MDRIFLRLRTDFLLFELAPQRSGNAFREETGFLPTSKMYTIRHRGN